MKELKHICFVCGKKINEGKQKDYFDGTNIQTVHDKCMLKPIRTKEWYKENRFRKDGDR